MNKELRELLEAINAKKAEVKNFVEKDMVDEAKVAKAELVQMQDKFDIMKDMEEPAPLPAVHEPKTVENVDPIHAFAEAARNGFKNAANNETTPAQGGYTVPEDIQTRINRFKEDRFKLEDLVSVERVSTLSGRRVYLTRSNHTGFQSVAEQGKIGQTSTPTFTPVTYSITKYAGYMPVTNELLEDSDANIANVLIEWLGEEDIATKNSLILAKIATLNSGTPVALADIDGIKKAVNVTLGSKFTGNVKIITNDDGFNYLDTLKKSANSSEYLLKPAQDPTKPMERRLAVGATQIPVVVVPNSILPSTDNGASGSSKKAVWPFYIGDFKEGITLFDRKQLTIMQSNTASVTGFNAFEQDMTLFRGIERLDCQIKDAEAIVYGQITEA